MILVPFWNMHLEIHYLATIFQILSALVCYNMLCQSNLYTRIAAKQMLKYSKNAEHRFVHI